MKARLMLAMMLTGVLVALASASAGAVGCSDKFLASESAQWSDAGNWSTKALPTENDVVCWAPDLTPVVTAGATAKSIETGGGLTVDEGSLNLAGSGGISSLSGTLELAGGTLQGSGTIDLTGEFAYVGGSFDTNMDQTGGGAFRVTGEAQAYFTGGEIRTESPVEIENPDFIAKTATLRTTSVIHFAPKDFKANGGASLAMFAAGFITSGATEVPNYELTLRGDASKIEGGRFSVPVLNTEEETTLTVPTGVQLSLGGGIIEGKVTGAGTFRAASGTTVVEAGGGISTNDVALEGGSLDVKVGASYKPAGETKIASGTLTLEGPGSTGTYTMTGGGAAGAGPLTVKEALAWSAGESSLNIKQAAGTTLMVTGTSRAYSLGGTIETESPIEIQNPNFVSNGSTIRTTSTVSFSPKDFEQNGGASLKLFAAGFITGGTTEIPNYELNLTGDLSKISGGRFEVPVLNMAPATTLEIPPLAEVSTGGGTIDGMIYGAGTFRAASNTTTLEPDGEISNNNVTLENGTLKVKPGAVYEANGETKVAGGTLALEGSGSTGQYSETAGSAHGTGALSVMGPVLFTAGELDLGLKQTGGESFQISGSSRAYLTGGSIESTSTLEISNPQFITAGGATVKTTGTIDLAKGLLMHENAGDSATFTAAGLGSNTGPSYGLGADSLVLTGGKTTIASGAKLVNGPITLEGGELAVEGMAEAPVALTGGKLYGDGTIGGSLTNTSGTVEPGRGGSGTLHLIGSFVQEAGGTLTETITGTTAGTDFGQISAEGEGQFGGHVAVRDLEGFQPVSPERFLIVATGAGNSGHFAGLTGESAPLYEAGYESGGAYLAPIPLPVNNKAPEITGTKVAGETVSCTTGTWSSSPQSYAYEWRLEGAQIPNQTTNSLELTAAEEGKKIVCVVTATNVTGSESAASTPIIVAAPTVAPQNTGVPSITGQSEPGSQLQCLPGSWTGSPTFGYQWSREGVQIAGATSSTYTITAEDTGHTLTCTVTASDGKSAQASASIAVAKTAFALSCADRPIVLISVLQSGHSVILNGVALPKYAGKRVTIAISDVPKTYAKGKGGSTVIGAGGSFAVRLALPKGRLAPLTRYTATVEGHSSLGLKLGRNLVITAETAASIGSKVSFHFVGPRGPGKGVITIVREESCTQTSVVTTAKLTARNGLTVTLPSPEKPGETTYYRAQTRIAAGITYSLPIAVTKG